MTEKFSALMARVAAGEKMTEHECAMVRTMAEIGRGEVKCFVCNAGIPAKGGMPRVMATSITERVTLTFVLCDGCRVKADSKPAFAADVAVRARLLAAGYREMQQPTAAALREEA